MADVDVVVVGAGFAGMVAARELAARGVSAVVLERDQHSGGRVRTEHRDGASLEHGGIFHTHGYPGLQALLDECGLAEDVRPTPTGFHAAVRRDGAFRFVDHGSVTGPLTTGVLGLLDKLSILRTAGPALLSTPSDLGDLTAAIDDDDRAVTDTLTRAAADYFTGGPHEFLWGVPSDRLSRAMLSVQLHVFRGDLRELAGGMGRLAESVGEGLDVRHGTVVTGVTSTAGGVEVRVEGADEPVRGRGAVIATQADVAARLWSGAPTAVADYLSGMAYARIDYVYLRTRGPIRLEADGRPVGMEVVTTREVDNTLGGVYVANAWTSDGTGLLLVTAANAARVADLSDEELADRLQADVEALHPEVAGQVIDRVVVRHPHYTPVFAPGTVRALASVRALLPSRHVDLAGDYMSAPWLEGAIRSGQQAAARTVAALR